MSLIKRLWNFLFGWLGLRIGELEAANPEVVYANTIRSLKLKYQKAKNATAQIKAAHMKAEKRDKEGDANRAEMQKLLDALLDEEESEENNRMAEELYGDLKVLEEENTEVEAEIVDLGNQLNSAMKTLGDVSTEIRKLEKEKSSQIAKLQTAEAKLEVQAVLDDLNPEAESAALAGVRSAIDDRVAKAEFNQNLADDSPEGRMKALKAKVAKKSSGNAVSDMRAARKAAKEAEAAKSASA